MAKLKLKILVTRTDRLGDVLLSLPVFQYMRKALPECEFHFLCHGDYGEIIGPYLRTLYVKPVETEFHDIESLREGFRSERYSAALFLYSDFKLAFASMRAKIKRRVGPWSQPWSYLLYQGLRQNRSRCIKTEAEYNLDLAQFMIKKLLGQEFPYKGYLKPIELPTSKDAAITADNTLKQLGIDPQSPFLVVHPGMGGSALNLAPETYAQWIPEIEAIKKMPVLLSVGPAEADRQVSETIIERNPNLKVIRGRKLPVLMEIFRRARLVVAPSTGPLHLAHYVGTDTVGLYPNLGTERKERWQPWGGSGRSFIVESGPETSKSRTSKGKPFLSLGPWQQAFHELSLAT